MGSSIYFVSIIYTSILFLSLKIIVFALPVDWLNFSNNTEALRIVSREEWGARPAIAHEPLEVTPTPYVVIHHGGIPRYCDDLKTCSAIVRYYQHLHLDGRGWFDIGYNFVIGEDGNAYEGRGWNYVGAHAPGYNTQSIGICVIGDFSDFLPNETTLRTLNALINYGVSLGKISESYHVIGHRQVRSTLCPGDELFKYVQTHPRWTSKPVPKYSTATNVTITERIVMENKSVVNTNKES